MDEVVLNPGAEAPAAETPVEQPAAATEETAADPGGDLSDAALVEAAFKAAAEAAPAEEPATDTVPPAASTTPAEVVPPAGEPPKPVDDAEARTRALVDAQVKAYQQAEAAKAERAAFEQRMRALEDKLAVYEGSDPTAILERLQERGMDLEVLTGAALGQKNPDKLVLRQAMSEIRELKEARKADLERREAELREREQRAAEVQYVSTQIRPVLESKKAEFPYLYAAHGDDGVPQVIYAQMNRIYGERGPDAVPAPHVVARELEAKAKQYYEAIHAKATQASAAKPATTPSPTPKPKSKTLNNGLTQGTPPGDTDMSDEALERAARTAVAAMAG